MSPLKICRICLRTDFELRQLNNNLSNFYQNLCERNHDNSENLSCSSCESMLKNFYNFKKQCRKSNKILRSWKKKKTQHKPPLYELHHQLSHKSSKFIEKNIPQADILQNITTIDIKSETPTEIDAFGDKSEGELKYEVIESTEVNDYGDHPTEEDDDDDKALSEFLSIIKTEDKLSNKEVGTDEPKTKRNRARRPLTNQQELETVFDIVIFSTEADAIREFSERRLTDRYINAQYKCDVCYTVYKCQKLLDFHMRWHRPTAGDFVCNVCEMRFKGYLSLRKHKNDVHFGLYKCKRCPLVTYHKMVMMHHFQKHQGVEFKCRHCGGVYRHSSTYMTHLRTRHRTDHVCGSCARTFVSEKGLLVHKKKVHAMETKSDSTKSATCSECNITFASSAVYTVHVLNTPKHKEFASAIIGCPECGQRFECRIKLRAHRRQYHPSYNYCAMKHAQYNVMNGRDADDRVFECQLCGKSGSHNTWLYRHYRADHPDVPYEQVHNEKRRHLCEECGRSFFTTTALREHKYLHTGAKPFTCDQCPAKFRRKTSLKIHLERHLPPTRECQRCGKKFVSASNLSNHMRSHIGDRRYKCEICAKGFLHSAALKEHVRGVHHHIRRARKHGKTGVE